MKEKIIWLASLVCFIVGLVLEYLTQNLVFAFLVIPVLYCIIFRTVLWGSWRDGHVD